MSRRGRGRARHVRNHQIRINDFLPVADFRRATLREYGGAARRAIGEETVFVLPNDADRVHREGALKYAAVKPTRALPLPEIPRVVFLAIKSNVAVIFERIRARSRITRLERCGFSVSRLCGAAARLRSMALAENEAASRWLKHAVRFEDGIVLFRANAAPEHVQSFGFAALLGALSGSPPPATRAAALLHRLSAASFSGATLSGCQVRCGDGGRSAGNCHGQRCGRQRRCGGCGCINNGDGDGGRTGDGNVCFRGRADRCGARMNVGW